MANHEHLTRVPKQQLREIGWTKAREPAKVAQREGERFESARWVHRAQALPKEEFKREVERHLTGRETEAWELLYFKLYKSQIPWSRGPLKRLASCWARTSHAVTAENDWPGLRQKRRRLELNPEEYTIIREQVLERDGWGGVKSAVRWRIYRSIT